MYVKKVNKYYYVYHNVRHGNKIKRIKIANLTRFPEPLREQLTQVINNYDTSDGTPENIEFLSNIQKI